MDFFGRPSNGFGAETGHDDGMWIGVCGLQYETDGECKEKGTETERKEGIFKEIKTCICKLHKPAEWLSSTSDALWSFRVTSLPPHKYPDPPP